jgi:hypothetical protein
MNEPVITVLSFPIWKECPVKLPEGFEARKGLIPDSSSLQEVFTIYHLTSQKHVDLAWDPAMDEIPIGAFRQQVVGPMMEALRRAITPQ